MNIYKEIKDRVSVRRMCDLYGIRVNNQGFANCPFHVERTASLKVYPGDRGFHCFGCGKSGDVIDFVKDLNHISAYDAAVLIDRELLLGLPIGKPVSLSERIRADRAKRAHKEAEDRENAKYTALKNAYERDLAVYVMFDLVKMRLAPMVKFDGLDGELDPVYMEALQSVEKASYRLDCSEAALRLYEIEHKR